MMNKTQRLEIKKAIDFVEELSWLFSSKKNLNFNEIPKLLRELLDGPTSIQGVGLKHTSPNPNIHFLIGILPRLFQDERLFPSNASIATFAQQVLNIDVPRYDKRSKYELIGLIVCETDRLSDDKLNKLVAALSEITGNEDKLNKMREAQKTINFSWNETIQSLTDNQLLL